MPRVLPGVVLRDVKGIRGDSDAPDPRGGAGGSLGPRGGSGPRAAPLRAGTRSPHACPPGRSQPGSSLPTPGAAGAEGAGTQIAAVAKATASRVSMAAAGTAPAAAAPGWGARAEGVLQRDGRGARSGGGGARGAEVSTRDTEGEAEEGSRAAGCSRCPVGLNSFLAAEEGSRSAECGQAAMPGAALGRSHLPLLLLPPGGVLAASSPGPSGRHRAVLGSAGPEPGCERRPRPALPPPVLQRTRSAKSAAGGDVSAGPPLPGRALSREHGAPRVPPRGRCQSIGTEPGPGPRMLCQQQLRVMFSPGSKARIFCQNFAFCSVSANTAAVGPTPGGCCCQRGAGGGPRGSVCPCAPRFARSASLWGRGRAGAH